MGNASHDRPAQVNDAPRLSETRLVWRLSVPVIAYRLPDDHELIRAAWVRLRREFGNTPRRGLMGAFDARTSEYRVCVEAKPGDHLYGGREMWRPPGGRFLAATLSGRPPEVFEAIPAFFSDVEQRAQYRGERRDQARSLLEIYHGGGVVNLLLPVLGVSGSDTTMNKTNHREHEPLN